MDIVLDFCDKHLLDSVWARILPQQVPLHQIGAAANYVAHSSIPSSTSIKAAATAAATYAHQYVHSSLLDEPTEIVSAWPRDDWRRQFLSLCAITMIGTHLMYFSVAGLSYTFLFDHRMMKHPRFLKNQIQQEIKCSLTAFPWLTLMIVPSFLAETRGWTLLYSSVADGPFGGGLPGWIYIALSCSFFLWFTDTLIYWIHRYEHHPSVYKHVHKPHHRWVVPTPFASHAFHPIDGYVQSLPYHMAVFLFPIHKASYLLLFVAVNLWTILIHDSDMIVNHPLENWINGPAHHTLHHLHFTCDYGQYFTFCDKLFGTYRHPTKADDPLLAVLAQQKADLQQELAQIDARSALEQATEDKKTR